MWFTTESKKDYSAAHLCFFLADMSKSWRGNPRATLSSSGPDRGRWDIVKFNLTLGWPRLCDHANLNLRAWLHLVSAQVGGSHPRAVKPTSLNWIVKRESSIGPNHVQGMRCASPAAVWAPCLCDVIISIWYIRMNAMSLSSPVMSFS